MTDHINRLRRLGERFHGVDLKFRRDGTNWPAKWKAECFSTKHEGARFSAHGKTSVEAIDALEIAVLEAMN